MRFPNSGKIARIGFRPERVLSCRKKGRVMEKREKSQKERLLEEAAGACVYCGHPLTVESLETDHIVPRSKGGTNEYGNKVCACPACNAAKADLDIRGFLAGFSGRRRRKYENRLDALVEQGKMSQAKRALLSDYRTPSGLPYWQDGCGGRHFEGEQAGYSMELWLIKRKTINRKYLTIKSLLL